MSMWDFLRDTFSRSNPQSSRILGDELAGQVRQVNDSVYEFYRPVGSPTMQILFFPGFSFKDKSEIMLSTWLSEDGSCLWPQTWLAEEFPSAHILAVSYEHVLKTGSENLDIFLITENIMSDVIHAKVGLVPHCPLVLVGHSLGGMVIKSLCNMIAQQLYYSSTSEAFRDVRHKKFLENLRGVFYYATPHHGIGVTELSMHGFWTNQSPTMRFFGALNSQAARLSAEFEKFSIDYEWKVAGLGEGVPTKLVFSQ